MCSFKYLFFSQSFTFHYESVSHRMIFGDTASVIYFVLEILISFVVKTKKTNTQCKIDNNLGVEK